MYKTKEKTSEEYIPTETCEFCGFMKKGLFAEVSKTLEQRQVITHSGKKNIKWVVTNPNELNIIREIEKINNGDCGCTKETVLARAKDECINCDVPIYEKGLTPKQLEKEKLRKMKTDGNFCKSCIFKVNLAMKDNKFKKSPQK